MEQNDCTPGGMLKAQREEYEARIERAHRNSFLSGLEAAAQSLEEWQTREDCEVVRDCQLRRRFAAREAAAIRSLADSAFPGAAANRPMYQVIIDPADPVNDHVHTLDSVLECSHQGSSVFHIIGTDFEQWLCLEPGQAVTVVEQEPGDV